MTGERTFRSLLLERDPEKLAVATGPLESIRDADFRHQAAAMAAGYNSVADMAIDELLKLVKELLVRVELLEQAAEKSGRVSFTTINRRQFGDDE